MLIILHRGNVFGPLSCEENSEHTIRTIIETFPEFHMEIDLRVDFNGDLFLGHDTPEHRTSIAFLTIYQTNLWIHAKDVNALLLCVVSVMNPSLSRVEKLGLYLVRNISIASSSI